MRVNIFKDKMKYPNLIKSRYNLTGKGRDWIRYIHPEDRAVLVEIGMVAWDFGRMGGKARAATALRDYRGRFISNPKYEIDYGDLHG